MLQVKDVLFETCYSHLEPDGTWQIFAVDRLINCLKTIHLKPGFIEIKQEVIKTFFDSNAISQTRLDKITRVDIRKYPILIALFPQDNSTILLDGRHRYYKAHLLGKRQIRCHLLMPEIYERFRVEPSEEMLNMDQKQLEKAFRNTPSMSN